jgi:hypothetical protein
MSRVSTPRAVPGAETLRAERSRVSGPLPAKRQMGLCRPMGMLNYRFAEDEIP